jgi:hypothetical protein
VSVPWVVLEAVEALHPLLIRILGKGSFSLTLLMLVEGHQHKKIKRKRHMPLSFNLCKMNFLHPCFFFLFLNC